MVWCWGRTWKEWGYVWPIHSISIRDESNLPLLILRECHLPWNLPIKWAFALLHVETRRYKMWKNVSKPLEVWNSVPSIVYHPLFILFVPGRYNNLVMFLNTGVSTCIYTETKQTMCIYTYPLVIWYNYRKSPFSMGKSTISIYFYGHLYHGELLVITRPGTVTPFSSMSFQGFPSHGWLSFLLVKSP